MKFNYRDTILLGFGFLGVSVLSALYNSYVPNFLESRFGLPTNIIGIFMALDNMAALFIQPPVGAWSDRIRTSIGRRMPFLLIGAPVSVAAFGLIPVASILPFFVACTSSFFLAMAFWRTPVIALMPDITPSKYRSQANGVINFLGGIGGILAFLGGGTLYKINPALPFWVGSGVVIVAGLLVFLFIKEPTDYQQEEKQPAMIESLREVLNDEDKSLLRILSAIFFWFLGFSAIEAFFTLYAKNHLGIAVEDGSRLLGHLSLFFVLFALPSGFIGARLGRRVTIMAGIFALGLLILGMYFSPITVLTTVITRLPILGDVLGVSIFLMLAGIAWASININALPMVVDMTTAARVGTFTGLYYLFSTLSAIAGPISNGSLIRLAGNDYNILMLFAPFSLLVAFLIMIGVKRGEATA